MADKAISDLTQALQITNEDQFVLEQGGEAKMLKGETLLKFVTLSVVSVTVTTLPAGSSATATYDKSTGTLALGIPQGSKGDTGATGATGPTNVLTIGSARWRARPLPEKPRIRCSTLYSKRVNRVNRVSRVFRVNRVSRVFRVKLVHRAIPAQMLPRLLASPSGRATITLS